MSDFCLLCFSLKISTLLHFSIIYLRYMSICWRFIEKKFFKLYSISPCGFFQICGRLSYLKITADYYYYISSQVWSFKLPRNCYYSDRFILELLTLIQKRNNSCLKLVLENFNVLSQNFDVASWHFESIHLKEYFLQLLRLHH